MGKNAMDSDDLRILKFWTSGNYGKSFLFPHLRDAGRRHVVQIHRAVPTHRRTYGK